MSQIIVLGWDALDIDLIQQYNLEAEFGPAKRIETIANPVIDEPHTKELWPSMITGCSPDEHGIHAVDESDGVDWDNPLIDLAATLATGVVPHSIRTEIGKVLREKGAGLDAKRRGYYDEHGLETVFDAGGRAISIPNYVTPFDEDHDLDGNRDDVWGAILPNRDGSEGLEPAVGLPAVYQTILGAAGERAGHTLAAIEAGHDLVFCWFGLLDTVGHIAPAVDAPIEAMAYRTAAGMAANIREQAPDDAIVVNVSDHGLQDGEHTHYATLATEHELAHEAIDHVIDLAGWIEQAREGRSAVGTQAYDETALEETTEQLKSLGYIEP